jgi:GAF domain-containing protein
LYARRLEVLHEIDQAILAARSPEEIANSALQRIRSLIPCQRVSVTRFDSSANRARVLAVLTEGETSLGRGELNLREIYYVLDRMEQGGVHLVADLRTVAQPSAVEQTLLAEGIRSYVKLPLLAGCRSEAGRAPTPARIRQNRREPAAWEPPPLGSPTAC